MLTEEQIKEKEFTPDQIELVNSVFKTKEEDLLALANKNADGILDGFSEKLKSISGIDRLEVGGKPEKVSSHFDRIVSEWLPTNAEQRILDAEKKANDKVLELENKIKNHKGDESLKTELQEAKAELAKIPDLLKEKDEEFNAKYGELENTYKSEKLNRSMADSMPKFDDNVNKFELAAKKKSAIERISKTYELSFDDNGNLVGRKDYKDTLVSELLKNDEELKDLILIEQSHGGGGEGSGRKPQTLAIPTNISKGAAQEIIKQHIIKNENIDFLDERYSDRFKELCKENNVL